MILLKTNFNVTMKLASDSSSLLHKILIIIDSTATLNKTSLFNQLCNVHRCLKMSLNRTPKRIEHFEGDELFIPIPIQQRRSK